MIRVRVLRGLALAPCVAWPVVVATGCGESRAEPANADPRFAAIEAYVEAYREMAAFDGVVLIAEGDEVVWERAFGYADYERRSPMTTEARFRLASLSKQVTATAIGRLVDRGAIRLDSRLAEALPDFPNAGRITIRQLLDHTAGVAHTNTLSWMDMTVPMTLDEIVAGLAGEALLFEPGTDSRYSNGGYALLAKVVEVLGGMSYSDFVEHELADPDYPSLGDESAHEAVPDMVRRYAPGPSYGERVPAETYITANRIGGGSIYGAARDVWRFFLDSYEGRLLEPATTAALFAWPEDGDVRITGRSPGTLAQVYLDSGSGLAVVTLSSSSGWPGSFNADVVSLYRGEEVALTPFRLAADPLSREALDRISGDFLADPFGWSVSIEAGSANPVFVQGRVRTAFAPTTDGEFHLPLYDWLCLFEEDGSSFTCRQRDPDATIRFHFHRQPAEGVAIAVRGRSQR